MHNRNFKFYRMKLEEEFFIIPLSVLEKVVFNDNDLIVLKGNEQMWLSEVDAIFKNYSDSEDDVPYKVYKEKFFSQNVPLTPNQLVLVSKFHTSYLNITEFWQYINSQEFMNVLIEVNTKRQFCNVVPTKDNMFDVLQYEKGTIELPQSLTMCNGEYMKCWDKLLTICKQ